MYKLLQQNTWIQYIIFYLYRQEQCMNSYNKTLLNTQTKHGVIGVKRRLNAPEAILPWLCGRTAVGYRSQFCT